MAAKTANLADFFEQMLTDVQFLAAVQHREAECPLRLMQRILHVEHFQ